ncbi:redoxin domain-containing protein [Candidatus Poribacteria bacterium]|nr:redoxin domain-containing protein [Candidatus Poribacteria bacterium]
MQFKNQKNYIDKINRRYTFCSICVITMMLLLSNIYNITNAESVEKAVELSPAKIGYKYQEIKSIAKKNLNKNDTDVLENIVSKSQNFIQNHPKYKRIDEIYYYLGNALIRLEKVEEGIVVFETLFKEDSDARYVPTILLELGLAYDKVGNHVKADEAYNSLIEHPKYNKRSQAKKAEDILEMDLELRTGELPKPQLPGSQPNQWIGKAAPAFKVMDLNNEEITLDKYHGQVVLIDFWATWCGPCIGELPNVKATYDKYKDKKFQIIGISWDKSQITLETFIKEQNLGWVHHYDPFGQIANQYGVTGIPSTFLLDGEGIIRKTDLRGPALEIAVGELVEENLKNPHHGPHSKSIPATKLIKPSNPTSNNSPGPINKPTNWIGKPAPEITITNLKGEELSLEDFKGQVVLLDFWATWCGPCITEIPKVKKTYEKYKDQKFQIIGISLDRSLTPLTEYIQQEELSWHHYWDEDRKIRTLFEVKAIPSAFLIDGDGIIQKAYLGGFDVETAVAELVDKNLKKVDQTPTNSGKNKDNTDN